MKSIDLPAKFFEWCKTCFCNPAFLVCINGSVSGYFKGKAGIRQGDLSSLPLFVIAMNVLSLMLNIGASEGLFGYHRNCDKIGLTHLCFTDDLLVFLDGSASSFEAVLNILDQFKRISGLSVNLDKTSLFTAGLTQLESTSLTTRFGLKEATLPVRYLGFPLCSKKLTHSDCDPLLA